MIVTTPTSAWLETALAECKKGVVISSPYVGDYLPEQIHRLGSNVSVELLTRTVIADFASNASDLDAVRRIAARAGSVLSLSSLHAKVYVVDSKRALITSANATWSGMCRNRECGWEVGRRDARELPSMIQSGFGSRPEPQRWTAEQLEELRGAVESLRAALPKKSRIDAPPRVRLPRRDYTRMVESFSGWLRLTLEGVSRISREVFTMDDVLTACAGLAAAQFPANQHVREKLRQQMQRLRDLGIVSFHGNGQYELLAKRG